MKVLILTGSPHAQGTTALLADQVCVGAQEAGHEVICIGTAKLNIHPCLGCYHCRNYDGQCVYDDDMKQIHSQLLTADAVVLVTPLYYFGMTAQLKRVIDRFFAINSSLRNTSKRLHLVAACGDNDEWAMDALVVHFQTLCRYLHWQEGEKVLAIGAYTREDLKDSDYPMLARKLGADL
ncbi:flavodoxin family protein [Paradesulfitobacterium ferrireducens]|uniref:flavodoxin family protein n=1 Tax=Paradesulfitobacterium ferrireducens TaxID=2816476 RepID=UPI001A8F5B2C|nr:flavodoxin family protein [Paradesulfitobacterium ferrireducens]